jgi:hypothetical protein
MGMPGNTNKIYVVVGGAEGVTKQSPVRRSYQLRRISHLRGAGKSGRSIAGSRPVKPWRDYYSTSSNNSRYNVVILRCGFIGPLVEFL